MKTEKVFTVSVLLMAVVLMAPLTVEAREKCFNLAKREATMLEYESRSSRVCVRFKDLDGKEQFGKLIVQQGDSRHDYGMVTDQCANTTGKAKWISGGVDKPNTVRACFSETHNGLVEDGRSVQLPLKLQ